MHVSSALRNNGALLFAILPLLVAGMSACGGSSGSSGQGGAIASKHVASTPPSAGCGSYAAPAVADPDGVVATLPKRYQDAYRGYGRVFRSAWRDFKPKHKPPYEIDLVFGATVNQFAFDLLGELKSQLKSNPLVRKVTEATTGREVNIPLQLQQFAAAVSRKPDLIIVTPLQPDAFFPSIRKAAAAGIPVVTVLGPIDLPEALNVGENSFQFGARTASAMVRLLGGKGRILYVHGFRTVTADIGEFKGTRAVIANCPGVKLAGEVDGTFQDATAKSETFKFLATHPAAIAAVQQTGGMSKGVMSAFMSTDRPLPIVGDIGGSKATLSYWQQHRESYQSVGVGESAPTGAAAAISIGLRTLRGQGPKLNTFISPVTLITKKNLAQWVEPGWNFNTAGTAPGPRSALLPEPYLDGLFERGQTPK